MDSLKKTYSLYVKNVSYLPAFYLLPAEFATGGCDYRESRGAHTRPYRELPRSPYKAVLGVPRGCYIQYMPYSKAERLMCGMAERLIAQNGWQELIECIKSNRCFEDFNGTKSKDYLSFFRDWYRTLFCEWVNFSESAAHGLQKDSFHTDAYAKCEFKLDYERFLSVQDDDILNLIRLLGERYAQRKRDEALRKERFARRKAELSEAHENAALRQMLGADYFDDSESPPCEEAQAPCATQHYWLSSAAITVPKSK